MSEKTGILISDAEISRFLQSQQEQGISAVSLKHYKSDLMNLKSYISPETMIDQDDLLQWIHKMQQLGYRTNTIKGRLRTANNFVSWAGRPDLRIQANLPTAQTSESITRQEYESLLAVAKRSKETQGWLLLELLGNVGLWLNDLKQVTVEAVKANHVLSSDGQRMFLLCAELQARLLQYAAEQCITSGKIFLSSNGLPLARMSISQILQKVAHSAGVSQNKVTARTLRDLNRFREKAGT